MKQVGSRREAPIVEQGNGQLLAQAAQFSETIAHLAPSTFIPKGVFRFKTHAEMN